jgi:hypothetical protein
MTKSSPIMEKVFLSVAYPIDITRSQRMLTIVPDITRIFDISGFCPAKAGTPSNNVPQSKKDFIVTVPLLFSKLLVRITYKSKKNAINMFHVGMHMTSEFEEKL